MKTIFIFELKRWLKNWVLYLYLLIFFSLGFLISAMALGYFDNLSATTSSNKFVNSALSLNGLLGQLGTFINFIIPAVVGATVYRDYKYNFHNIFYVYPFSKSSYILGKFLSGILVTVLISLSIGAAFLLASVLPFANKDLLAPIDFFAYIQPYLLFIIPNIFVIGAFVFALVTLTRNEYIGFVFVIILILFQSFIHNMTNDVDDKFWVSLLDPYGAISLEYLTEYWTIEEQNTLLIPFKSALLYNRLVWVGLGILVFVATYFIFSFNYTVPSFFGKKKKAQRFTKNNFGGIIKINLPKVSYHYDFWSNFKTAISLSKFEFKLIVKNRIFLVFITLLMLFIVFSGYTLGQELFGTRTYPVTWKVIAMVKRLLEVFLLLIIYLFAGISLNNASNFRVNHLVDSTPVPNWVLLMSKVLGLIKMVILIMLVSIISGMLIQSYYGYFKFEIGQYLITFLGLELLYYIIVILYAVFIQGFFKNYLVGFFVIILSMMYPFVFSRIGLEHNFYYFNSSGGSYSYSDMNGFGIYRTYLYYKLYWLLFCGVLYLLTLTFWRRGIFSGAKERIKIFLSRVKQTNIAIPLVLFVVSFLSLGYAFYHQTVKLEPYYSRQEEEKMMIDYEKQYKKYENYPQPRIVDVKVDMAIFPKERNYKATAEYTLVNKTERAIDSLFVNYHNNLKVINFSTATNLVHKDSVQYFDIYRLKTPLQPGESIKVNFTVQNKPNTWLKDRSPILENGTFINNSIFPSFGYNANAEIKDNDIRKKYQLPDTEIMADPKNLKARENTYIATDSDWINFEATVSTSADQIAIAPGYLQKEWSKNGRRYFHYKMDQKMLNFYAFNSGRYEVKKEKYNGINYEIYYHKGHEYNLDRMMEAMKKSIKYYSENFSPYQHKQARIIEFPKTEGTFAQAFANTMPFSEGIGFIAMVDLDNPNSVDYPFSVVSHEMAHQWWAHQVIGANTKGSTLLSESLSEYSSLKVLEKEYGKYQMRKFLKEALDKYLQGRTFEWKEENPLMYVENQQYIHYDKGALVLYAMSDYLGEKNFNNILKSFVKKTAFQEAPYTTSIEFVEHLKANTPSHLQYLIRDMFETITLYDNRVEDVKVTPLPNGKYQVDIRFLVSKYQTNPKGDAIYKDAKGKGLEAQIRKSKVKSLPLADYIEIGVFGEPIKKNGHQYENEIYNKKYFINKIDNHIRIVVDKKPYEVGVDSYNKLIDRVSEDNRKRIK
ncbi:hypothetical protein K6T44_00905 [Riemerella anatipestifer]|uniref:ABC transporter permease/M1 family aminopeptidase n=1 Tax=Riemerella anatipestifer TaxID=34085 RepID=UPI001E80AF38|nr:M1 family aminopeptidase [Riemerella anatipestifer]QZO99880.1 hypothetical protein K6T44_00905 [Riemerella anatipestifer]